MNDRELRVKLRKAEVCQAEIRLKKAKLAMDKGYDRLKAYFEKSYAELKLDYEDAQQELVKEKAYLENAKHELENGDF